MVMGTVKMGSDGEAEESRISGVDQKEALENRSNHTSKITYNLTGNEK
jgi:hypothetical protein